MIKNILLVDDDPYCNRMNSFVLEQHGSVDTILTYENAIDALKYLGKLIVEKKYDKFPDVILLDLHMSYMDGWGFLDNFAQLPDDYTAKTSVFILTSSIQASDREKATLRTDISGYIEKPFTVAELDYVIAHCMTQQSR